MRQIQRQMRYLQNWKVKALTLISFLDFRMKGKSNSEQKSEQTRRHISKEYWAYETISLKLYLEIAGSGNIGRLHKKGKPDAECEKIWEDIVKQNQKANGSYEFDIYFFSTQDYALLLNDYIFIKAALMKLSLEVDRDLVKVLAGKGYRISLENSEEYAKTLLACLRRSENLITKTVMKHNELAEFSKARSGAKTSFEEVMANLSFGLGFTVPDSITLARYNEYRKILKAKFKKHGNIHKSK